MTVKHYVYITYNRNNADLDAQIDAFMSEHEGCGSSSGFETRTLEYVGERSFGLESLKALKVLRDLLCKETGLDESEIEVAYDEWSDEADEPLCSINARDDE
ncbi:hypothetical protein R2G56_21075 [Nitratireductor aquimarinus]|uniref:Uncharacterized protein n=1 Tax=Nitratireductor aquimarinus TaxID=889300 RepID=A0ABU4ARB8_9HYPH|nr:hypothetical protein [Nitratireductor aquimarinus]MDV6228788.1 hypothetical protein [Nitratireductor aquimarinus]